MTQRFFIIIAVVVLAVCLVSGGCLPSQEEKAAKTWKDLVNLLPDTNSPEVQPSDIEKMEDAEPPQVTPETIEVSLFFANADGSKLVEETRLITKEEGIARKTISELIKGPSTAEYMQVLPEGTRLLDINVKPDGLCIVDFSGEAREVSNRQQEELMVMAVANTVGQFPTVTGVSFMIEGEPVDEIAGFMDLSKPIEPKN